LLVAARLVQGVVCHHLRTASRKLRCNRRGIPLHRLVAQHFTRWWRNTISSINVPERE
jgi:hypothetical protein